MRNYKKHGRILFYIGSTLTIAAVFLKFSFPYLLTEIVQISLAFSPDSKVFVNWRVNKLPYVRDYYFYNWTNPEDIFNTSIKPKFEEVGPYRFDVYLEKHNVTFNDNGTISFYSTKKFIPRVEEGTRPFTDLITTLNPVPNTIAYKVRNWNFFAKLAISVALRSVHGKLHITRSVDEFLFTGFYDPMLDTLSKIPVAAELVIDRFGYFYKKNYTDLFYGPTEMYVTSDERYGQIEKYMGGKYTDFFPGKCGIVEGTCGEFIGMNRDPNKQLKVFNADLSTSVNMEFDKQVEVNGIIGDRYLPVEHIFDNGTYYPEEQCFCTGECLPQGVLNVSVSQYGAPIFLSLPHFYSADPIYINSVDIKPPEKERDVPYGIYEPFTGILTKIRLRIQINMLLQPVEGIGMYADIPKYLFPVLYLDEKVLLNKEGFDEMYLIKSVKYFSNIFLTALIGFGTLLTCAAILILCSVQDLRCDEEENCKKNEQEKDGK